MAVVIETTVGDLTVDLFLDQRPRACQNFLKLCALKYYNFNLFHTIQQGFIAQTGDPTGVGDGGAAVWSVLEGTSAKRYFRAEQQPRIRHSEAGLLSMVSVGDGMIGSQFLLTLGDDLASLDAGTHCVIGQVTEGFEVLRTLNDTICDAAHRPYKDVRITHTVVLDDPFEAPRGFRAPSRSPSPSAERLANGRIAADEDVDDTAGKTEQEVAEMQQEREAKARATILEIVGDLPDADMAPPENVLFVCKLNPVTSDDDLEIIFSRFGRVVGCEVIRDRVTGDSLQYAFVEFEDAKQCESAYFKMDNVLIDDRRIHVDFSQSVAKVQWRGKGKGLIYRDGQKGDRLNFGDLKQSRGGGGGGGGGGRDHQRRPAQPRNGGGDGRRNERRPSPRSPQRAQASNSDRSGNQLKRDREHRPQRPRSRERQRSRSRERQHQQRPAARQSRSPERSSRRDNEVVDKSKSTATRRSRSPDRSHRRDAVADKSKSTAARRSRSPERSSRRDATADKSKSSATRRRSRSRSPAARPPRRRSADRTTEASRPRRRAASASGSGTSDSESDSDDDASAARRHRQASKKSKTKKSKKSKKSKSSKKSRKHRSSSSSSDTSSSEASSDDSAAHRKSKKKSSKKHRK